MTDILTMIEVVRDPMMEKSIAQNIALDHVFEKEYQK